ncbi:MAG: hypothetical protein RR932_08545, partial [Acinetobacter sp.]
GGDFVECLDVCLTNNSIEKLVSIWLANCFLHQIYAIKIYKNNKSLFLNSNIYLFVQSIIGATLIRG